MKIGFADLMRMSREKTQGRETRLPSGQYILLEALYNGGIDFRYEILIHGAEHMFKLTSDTGCMLVKPYTRDHAWRIGDPKKAHDLGLVLGIIRGVRIKVRLASPIKDKLK